MPEPIRLRGHYAIDGILITATSREANSAVDMARAANRRGARRRRRHRSRALRSVVNPERSRIAWCPRSDGAKSRYRASRMQSSSNLGPRNPAWRVQRSSVCREARISFASAFTVVGTRGPQSAETRPAWSRSGIRAISAPTASSRQTRVCVSRARSRQRLKPGGESSKS